MRTINEFGHIDKEAFERAAKLPFPKDRQIEVFRTKRTADRFWNKLLWKPTYSHDAE